MQRSHVVFSQTHPFLKKWAVPEIIGKGNISDVIRNESKFAKMMFRTPLPCVSPFFAIFCRTKCEKVPKKLKFERYNLSMKDGGTIGIDKVTLSEEGEKTPEKPIIIIFPGLINTTYSTKIQTLSAGYLQAGYSEVLVCNHRGKCNTPLTTPQFTIPLGRFNGISEIVDYVCDKYKDRKILLAGDCYGASCIVDYLMSDNALKHDAILGGVTHSVPWNLPLALDTLFTEPCFSLIMKSHSRTYKKVLVAGTLGSERFAEMIYNKVGREQFSIIERLPINTENDVRKVYKHVMAPLHDGFFTDMDDYFKKTSSHIKVGNSHKPLIVINSADDFMAPITADNIKKIESDPNICFWLFATGGHCAYVKSLFPVTSIIDEVMIECSNILVKRAQH